MNQSLALLPPPPRRVRGILAGGREGWFVRLFMMPHTLVGIGALGYLVLYALWIWFGADVEGVVTDTEMSESSKRGRSYTVHYDYKIGNDTKSGSDGVGLDTYERLSFRADHHPKVMVRYFSLGPFDHAELSLGGSPWRNIRGLVFWVTAWDTFVGFVVWMYWIKPLRVRQLYKHGEAAPGMLTGKRVQQGRSSTYYVSYTFNDPLTGAALSGEIQVWDAAVWGVAYTGQPVTVLYASGNPRRSTVCEYGGYKVDMGSAFAVF